MTVMAAGSNGATTTCTRQMTLFPLHLIIILLLGVCEEVVACRSACNAYGSARYCCSGDYGAPAACGPTNYSQVFKAACPVAYSYAYDDASSTFTCAGAAAYHITFCPTAAS